MKKNIYLIMDARANYDIDKAVVFEVCNSKIEAESKKKDMVMIALLLN